MRERADERERGRPSGPGAGDSRLFSSDNAAGVHPEVLAAINEANRGHALAYGEDRWTRHAERLFRREFGDDATALLVFGGTGANVAALAAVTEPHQAVLCAHTAHLWNDECGAPERFVGCQLVPVRASMGRLDPTVLEAHLRPSGGVHRAQPRVVSISQATELGTVYAPTQLRTLAELAHARGLLLHVDGARLVHAAAALGTRLGALTREVGVDLLSFGGTKCGLLGAEAVVLLDPALAGRAAAVRKQATQLPSKMRFVAAQLVALLEHELWRSLATHAHAMATRLCRALAGVVEPAFPVETNAVFARLPEPAVEPLRARFGFHSWPHDPEPSGGRLVRWMTSWDTRPEDVDAFAAAIRAELGRPGGGPPPAAG